jgi:O-antigen biosynthesis protein
VSVQWDAIIVNYNGELFLNPCISALVRGQHPPARIIVVDNASEDDSLRELVPLPDAEVIEAGANLGYSGGANRGFSASDAPVAVVMNPDVELDPDYGRILSERFSNDPTLGCAGAKLTFPNSGLIQHAGGVVHFPQLTTSHLGENAPETEHLRIARDVDYVTGAAIAIRREAFEQIGGFDEAFFPAYWEDVDLCYRFRAAGWSVRYEPELSGIHHEGAGNKRGLPYFTYWTRNRLRFAQRHLSAEQWWSQFIPAEITRLRGELMAIESDEWFVRSGGAALEELARAGTVLNGELRPAGEAEPLVTSIHSIRELAPLADPSPEELGPSDGVLRRLKRFLSRFSGRIYAEELYWQQRQFNESVVRAFDAQDRLNRELAVQLLLTLTLINQREYKDS